MTQDNDAFPSWEETLKHLPKEGGLAFPFFVPGSEVLFHGMTLRQYYAGQALAGFASSIDQDSFIALSKGTPHGSIFSAAAFTLADAMIKEGNKTP